MLRDGRLNNMTSFINLVAKTIDVDPSEVVDDLNIDNCDTWTSLTHVALLSALESAYGVQFDIEESIEMDSIASIKDVLHNKGVSLDA